METETPTNPVEDADAYLPGVETEADGADDGAETLEELEAEIEHEGQVYRVPEALKGAFLRHADYTRKTQEVAEQRRLLETERRASEARAEHERAHAADYGRLAALDAAVADYEDYDWDLWFRQNPEQAQVDWARFQQAQGLRAEVGAQLHARQRLTALEAQRDHATRLEQGHAELARDIEDWSPALARELAVFGHSLGFSPDELNAVTDPRAVKVLHAAWRGAKALRQETAGRELERAQAFRPVRQVGGSASAPRDPARMSTAEWMRWRSEQTRRKAR
ncbi:hypothetical protein [Caulobacter sp. 17J65-9]|uniref:hypothetical protein n=1 Tax=Caulobacter sp. 17J65-9 TaxID=2709382 RepID=UPI0013C79F4C|nr:hypothetical protein [Caulobacter sp. 17J65-9]NEX93994.1 hypothetical protein [Caulobacter sp. 17J65-9]